MKCAIFMILLSLWVTVTVATNTEMEIDNVLGEGLQAKVHCTGSSGDDKGDQVINDGKSYVFDFTPTSNTIYNCIFSYRDGSVSAKTYDSNRDLDRCSPHCTYRISKDGVSGYNKQGQADLHFQWGGGAPLITL